MKKYKLGNTCINFCEWIKMNFVSKMNLLVGCECVRIKHFFVEVSRSERYQKCLTCFSTINGMNAFEKEGLLFQFYRYLLCIHLVVYHQFYCKKWRFEKFKLVYKFLLSSLFYEFLECETSTYYLYVTLLWRLSTQNTVGGHLWILVRDTW